MKRTAAPAPRRGAKTAKAEPEDDAGVARARALNAAAAGDALSGAAALAALDAVAPCLPGGCRRTRDAPNCLCRLVPPPGGHRDGSLWARVPAALAALNSETDTPLRKARAPPPHAHLARSAYARLTDMYVHPRRRSSRSLLALRTWARRATSTPCCSVSSTTRPSAPAFTQRSRRCWTPRRRCASCGACPSAVVAWLCASLFP
jgi:hypothetical protein